VPLPDEKFLASASRKELVDLARKTAMQAIEVGKTNEMLQTKLGLIISLLYGNADVRCAQSMAGDLDLFSEGLQITGEDERKLLPASDVKEARQVARHPRNGLTGCSHVVEKVFALAEEQVRSLEDSGFLVRVLGEDVSEYYQVLNSMVRIRV
jgi:hypothetical protein